MGNFVVGLMIVQLLLGAYMFSFTAGVGRPESVARATRLPSTVVFGHMALPVVALVTWIVYLGTRSQTVAWIAFAILLAAAGLGLILLLRTVGRPVRLPVTPGHYPEDADVTVAEELIPQPVMALYGLVWAGLLLCSFLVAIGV